MKNNKNQTRKHVFALLITGVMVLGGPATFCNTSLMAYMNYELQMCEPISDNVALKAQNELASITAEFEAEEEVILHAAAPVQKGWFGRVLDEVARWFGLSE